MYILCISMRISTSINGNCSKTVSTEDFSLVYITLTVFKETSFWFVFMDIFVSVYGNQLTINI